MTSPCLTQRCRTIALVLATVASTGCLTACQLPLVDTPLGATGDQRAVTPGEPITGTVANPDGKISVTFTSTATPQPRPGTNSAESRDCAYDDGDYSCPTDDLPQGPYRVEVTDAKFPSEGTHFVDVVVTDVPDYNPSVVLGQQPNTAALTGWAPGKPVSLTLIDANLAREIGAPVTGTPDQEGELTLSIPDLHPGTSYAVDATDGLWSTDHVDGWDRVFLRVD